MKNDPIVVSSARKGPRPQPSKTLESAHQTATETQKIT